MLEKEAKKEERERERKRRDSTHQTRVIDDHEEIKKDEDEDSRF